MKPNPMNPDVKFAWVEALRGGTYRQTRDALRRGNKFCVLGVLCDLAVKEGLMVEWLENEDSYETSPIREILANGKSRVEAEVCDGSLPELVMKWAGLTEVDPIIEDYALSVMNDGGSDFDELALVIEKYL